MVSLIAVGCGVTALVAVVALALGYYVAGKNAD